MGMTMTQKILANAAGKESVKAGELIMARCNEISQRGESGSGAGK